MQQSADYQRRLHLPPPPPPDFFSQYFSLGLKVLLVGIDNATQNSIQKQLRPPHYYITHCHTGSSALQHLLDKDSSFDLILSDVFLQDMDGYQFVRRQRSNTNIPHVLISGLERSSSSIKTAYKSGVCYVLWKPVSDSELKNLWQHVCRRREQGDDLFNGNVDDNHNHQQQQNQLLVRQNNPHPHHQDEGCSSSLVSRDKSPQVEDDREFLNKHHGDQQRSSKKRRVVWSGDLHQRFLDAVNYLGGVEKAVPKAILEGMNMSALTRENVASHLQKYRMYLRRMADKQLREHQHMKAMAGNRIPPCSGRGEGSYGRFICGGTTTNNNNNISPQPVTIRLHPDTRAFQNPNNNNNPHLLEPSRNNFPPLPHLTDEGPFLSSLAHHGHHSNQPHHHHHQMQMPMQPPPQQNFGFGRQVVPMAMVPSSAFAGNGSNMQQQQIAQNLITSGVHQQKLEQNLALASCHGNKMKQFDQNLGSASYHGGNRQHHQDQNLASGTSHGSNMQINQNLTSGIHHLESSQIVASSSCHGGNMQHVDQNLASGSCPGNNMQHVDQNLASGSCYVTTTIGGNNNDGSIKSEAAPVIRDRDDDDDDFFDNFDDNLDEAIPNLLMADPHHTQYQLHD